MQAGQRGTPQGVSPVSPLLANLFLHYAFDRWMATHFPRDTISVRYADDGLIHCRSFKQACYIRQQQLGRRLKDVRIGASSRQDPRSLLQGCAPGETLRYHSV